MPQVQGRPQSAVSDKRPFAKISDIPYADFNQEGAGDDGTKKGLGTSCNMVKKIEIL